MTVETDPHEMRWNSINIVKQSFSSTISQTEAIAMEGKAHNNMKDS